MSQPKDAQAEAAWEMATRVVELLRWDREEQRAEAFVEILLVVEGELERFLAARRRIFIWVTGEPGSN